MHGQNVSVIEHMKDTTRLQTFSNRSLEISHLSKQDEGIYRCTASNSIGFDNICVILINKVSLNTVTVSIQVAV